MTGYEHCPSLLTERVLLSTYRYIFMAPHDRRFSALCPDGICGMLRQNGVPPESLYYQNYDGPKDPSVSQGAEEAVPLSEKMEKNGRNIAREKRTVQNTKVKNTKAKNKGIRM